MLTQQADRCLAEASMVSLNRHPDMLVKRRLIFCW